MASIAEHVTEENIENVATITLFDIATECAKLMGIAKRWNDREKYTKAMKLSRLVNREIKARHIASLTA